jgi:aminopeptidase N
VLNEPDGTRTWLPSNDHPSDKATFTFTLHVGPGVTAVANGALVSHTSTEAGETWVWREDQPMATYLVQLLTGDYALVDGAGPDGLPLSSAVLRSELSRLQPTLDDIDDQIAYFEQFFGPFPLDGYGIAVTDSSPGLAMETQGRSLFSKDDLGGVGEFDDVVLSHELAHQWFGDAVSPARWQDVWLNESFATYGEWMYGEHTSGVTVRQQAAQALAQRPPGVTADPTVPEMFGFDVYQGGAAALEALRLTIGDDEFFELLREWVARNDGTSRTTEDFIALAEEVSGQDLGAFFDEWIFAERPPTSLPDPSTAPPVTTGS